MCQIRFLFRSLIIFSVPKPCVTQVCGFCLSAVRSAVLHWNKGNAPVLGKPSNSSYCVCVCPFFATQWEPCSVCPSLPLLVFLSLVLSLLFGTASDGTPAVVRPFLSKDAFSCSEFPPSALEYQTPDQFWFFM